MANYMLGTFHHVDIMLSAAQKLKHDGFKYTLLSPIPLTHEAEHLLGEHEAEHVLGDQKNTVRYFTFLGGFSGFFTGTIIALGTAALYVLPRGGRSIWAIQPTALISYETTILFGVLMTLFGFLVLTQLSSRKKIDDPDIQVDSFGILVEDVSDFKSIESFLKEHGASEVKRIEK